MAITTNVYGRRNASRTIHIEILPALGLLSYCALWRHVDHWWIPLGVIAIGTQLR
jgi:hypothetical protein